MRNHGQLETWIQFNQLLSTQSFPMSLLFQSQLFFSKCWCTFKAKEIYISIFSTNRTINFLSIKTQFECLVFAEAHLAKEMALTKFKKMAGEDWRKSKLLYVISAFKKKNCFGNIFF
jgi:hypothetical protein